MKDTTMVCPHCASKNIIVHGKTNSGNIRYKCKSCLKTFTNDINSIFFNSHNQSPVWEAYVKSMLEGDTIRESANKCGISLRTSFIWRHKILDALSSKKDLLPLDGSYNIGTMYYKAFKSKHKEESVYMGIAVAINEKGESKSVLSSVNRVSPESVDKSLSSQIENSKETVSPHPEILRDLAPHNKLKLCKPSGVKYKFKRIEQHKVDVYDFTKRFKGLSAKYLSNYLTWFDLRNKMNEDDLVKIISNIAFNERFEDVTDRPEVPDL